ncbi:MAG: hypothetical protein WD960_09295 [Gemmatimonadota bacterium]
MGTLVLGSVAALVATLLILELATPANLTLAALYGGWALWYRRKAGRELEELKASREEEG